VVTVGDRDEEVVMHANPGDRIIIKGHRRGEPDRDGEILEVRGVDGGPPYLVRWDGSDHAALLFPGCDAVVQEFRPAQAIAGSKESGNAHH
jgi:hypothetical protein